MSDISDGRISTGDAVKVVVELQREITTLRAQLEAVTFQRDDWKAGHAGEMELRKEAERERDEARNMHADKEIALLGLAEQLDLTTDQQNTVLCSAGWPVFVVGAIKDKLAAMTAERDLLWKLSHHEGCILYELNLQIKGLKAELAASVAENKRLREAITVHKADCHWPECWLCGALPARPGPFGKSVALMQTLSANQLKAQADDAARPGPEAKPCEKCGGHATVKCLYCLPAPSAGKTGGGER